LLVIILLIAGRFLLPFLGEAVDADLKRQKADGIA